MSEQRRSASPSRGKRYAGIGILFAFVLPIVALAISARTSQAEDKIPNPLNIPIATGVIQTFSNSGFIDFNNPFFQNHGTNGRTCATCHLPAEGWTITADEVKLRFDATQGLDPLFRTIDGSNSPLANVSTVLDRQNAYSMLINKAVIRIGLPIPANAEFELAKVDDPYGFASAQQLSLFRRPLPATNLGFLSTVMFDGRATIVPITSTSTSGVGTLALQKDLAFQANDADQTHAQASSTLTDKQLQQIVDFELANFTAKSFDDAAGDLTALGAQGGAINLANQPFFIGINDPLGLNPKKTPFNPRAMTLYDSWKSLGNTGGVDDLNRKADREAVARGQEIFNTLPINIVGVAGLNDATGQAVIQGTCTTCHDTPNVGDHSVSVPLNIGIADGSLRTPDMPLYTLRNKKTGETVSVTDPGRALITGKWADVGKFKGPILRGLSARAPYFHNGSAATLDDVINFFENRFGVELTQQQQNDLAAFLRTL